MSKGFEHRYWAVRVGFGLSNIVVVVASGRLLLLLRSLQCPKLLLELLELCSVLLVGLFQLHNSGVTLLQRLLQLGVRALHSPPLVTPLRGIRVLSLGEWSHLICNACELGHKQLHCLLQVLCQPSQLLQLSRLSCILIFFKNINVR